MTVRPSSAQLKNHIDKSSIKRSTKANKTLNLFQTYCESSVILNTLLSFSLTEEDAIESWRCHGRAKLQTKLNVSDQTKLLPQ